MRNGRAYLCCFPFRQRFEASLDVVVWVRFLGVSSHLRLSLLSFALFVSHLGIKHTHISVHRRERIMSVFFFFFLSLSLA